MAVQHTLPPPPAAVLAQLDLNSLLDMPFGLLSGTDASPQHHLNAEHQLLSLGGSHCSARGENAEAATLNHTQLTAAAGSDSGDQQSHVSIQSSFSLKALKQAVRQDPDPDADVHASLYHMLLQCEPDAADWESDGKTMLEESGHQQVLQSLELARLDLCYNFHRYESWEKVFSEYKELVHGTAPEVNCNNCKDC